MEDYNGPLDVGLDAAYYNSLFELEEALCTQAYDKFTLGGSLSPGDTVDARNMFNSQIAVFLIHFVVYAYEHCALSFYII